MKAFINTEYAKWWLNYPELEIIKPTYEQINILEQEILNVEDILTRCGLKDKHYE